MRKIIDLDLDKIEKLYLSGKTIYEISKSEGVSQQTIHRRLKLIGINMRKPRPRIGKIPWNRGKKLPHLTGVNCPAWKGGKRYCSGYVEVWIDGKYRREHRLVMEEKLGRKLKSSEVVHHINEIKSDNRSSNLQLFINRAEHRRYHSKKDYKNGIGSIFKINNPKKSIV